MALTFHPPKFGYNYPSNAVLVPTPAVAMITATTGDLVYALGYHVDAPPIIDVTIPSGYQFSVDIPNTHQPGPHLLHFFAFNSVFDLFTAAFPFTITGGTPYAVPAVTEVKNQVMAGKKPKHKPKIHKNQVRPNVGDRVIRDLEVTITPDSQEPNAPTPHLICDAYFTREGTKESHPLGSTKFVNRADRVGFSLIHPKTRGTITIRSYLWDPDGIKAGVKDNIAIESLEFTTTEV